MRTSTAYFAGVGTVIAAVVAGLGGGLIISDVVSPQAPRTEMSKLELRMSERPILSTNTSSEPVPHVAAAAPTKAQSEPVTTGLAQGKSPDAAAIGSPPAGSPQPTASPVTQAAMPEKTNSEPSRTPEATFARASAADVRTGDTEIRRHDREARREARRAAEEKRRAERRQYWIERRQLWTERRRPRQEQELREVEQRVREETEPTQAFASEPVRLETPRIRLFGDD